MKWEFLNENITLKIPYKTTKAVKPICNTYQNISRLYIAMYDSNTVKNLKAKKHLLHYFPQSRVFVLSFLTKIFHVILHIIFAKL